MLSGTALVYTGRFEGVPGADVIRTFRSSFATRMPRKLEEDAGPPQVLISAAMQNTGSREVGCMQGRRITRDQRNEEWLEEAGHVLEAP